MHLFAVSFSTCFECKAMFSISNISTTIFARFENRVSQQYAIMNTNNINRTWTPNLRNESKNKHHFYPEIVADTTTRNWKRDDMYFNNTNLSKTSKQTEGRTLVTRTFNISNHVQDQTIYAHTVTNRIENNHMVYNTLRSMNT